MKRLILAVLFTAALLPARAEAGLVWTSTAALSIRQRPSLDGTESVRATGIHRLTVTDMGIFTEFFIRIHSGVLAQNVTELDGCSTDWLHIKEVTTVGCATTIVQSPCVNGVWEAVTTGKIRYVTMVTRTKIGVSEPVFVNCSCI